MIKSFHNREIEKIWGRERAPKLPHALQRPAQRKLLILDAADSLQDLRVPLGNPSKKMTGAHRARLSVHLNDQWQVRFQWRESDAYAVEIAD